MRKVHSSADGNKRLMFLRDVSLHKINNYSNVMTIATVPSIETNHPCFDRIYHG